MTSPTPEPKVEIENKPWHIAWFLTIIMSLATGIGTVCSSYLLLYVKNEEEANRAETARKARGAEIHCDKLREAASLAAEIGFSADRGIPISSGLMISSRVKHSSSIKRFHVK